MNPLKPSEVVMELDKYIIGQDHAKRSVAIPRTLSLSAPPGLAKQKLPDVCLC